jgi:2-polyprenyl-3-methyl-5-hydroxy-6-metoxy-1,4-benzoquinol methylase
MDINARENAQKQWNTTPCGSVDGNESFTLDYFKRVEKERYTQQYWHKAYFPFTKFGGKKILEIGIGHGTDLAQFGENGSAAYGIDITDRHIELTKKNFELRGLSVEIRKDDATNISYPPNFFDGVYSFGVLHHIPEMNSCIKSINKVLKSEGTLMMGLYYKYSLAHLKLVLQGLVTGRLFKLGYYGLLATIEMGADGIKIKPYVKLYSKREVRELMIENGFEIEHLNCRQVYFNDFKFLNLFRVFENYLGW